MKPSDTKGFTLLEVLLVIAIILIIAGLALPRFFDVQEHAKEAVARGDLRVLQTAIDSYLLNTNTLPDPFEIGPKLEGAKPAIITDYESFKDPFAPPNVDQHYHYANATSPDGLKKYYVFWSIGRNQTDEVTGIDENGVLTGTGDDVYVTNGRTPS